MVIWQRKTSVIHPPLQMPAWVYMHWFWKGAGGEGGCLIREEVANDAPPGTKLCQIQNRQRTSAHFSHIFITFCTNPAETKWSHSLTVPSLWLSVAFGTDQFGRVHARDTPCCVVDAFNHFFSYKSACMCFVCRGKHGCAFFTLRSHSKFLCAKSKQKNNTVFQKRRVGGNWHAFNRMQATPFPADSNSSRLPAYSADLPRLQVFSSGWPWRGSWSWRRLAAAAGRPLGGS